MSTTLTPILKLRVNSNLTADAKYNLYKIDELATTFLVDNNGVARIRSATDITIQPNDSSIGGTGTGGGVTVGTESTPISEFQVWSDTFSISGDLSLADQADGGTRSLLLKYDSSLSGSVDTVANRTLTIDLQSSDRSLILGGNLTTSGGSIVLAAPADSTYTLPATGTLVSTTATQVLTNKTLGSTNTATGIRLASFTPDGTNTLTAPTVTDTLVARTTTDTLTNKTLGSTNTATGIRLASFTPDGAHTLTAPTTTDTLVARTTTDTLTNKSLDAGSNTITGLTNTSIASGAGIVYSKLTLTNSIVNGDISNAAAIAYSKLSLTGGIVNSDVSSSAAIAGTKVDPTFGAQTIQTNVGTSYKSGGTKSTLVRASTTAQPSDWTFTLPPDPGTNGYILFTNGSGTSSWGAPPSGISSLTGDVTSSGTGVATTTVVSVGGATATEVGYTAGVTSPIQAQIDAKVSTSSLGAGVATFLGTPSSANLASAVTDETGSGSLVFATSPTLVTPLLGTPTSGVLTNCTGLPIDGGTTGTLPASRGGTGVTSLGSGVATFLGTPSSANLAAALTDETGSGAAVFATSPTLVTPLLGTPTSGNLSNCTALPIDGGTTGTLPESRGGTGITSLGSGVATFLGTPSSANLAAAVTDETGSGALVFGTSPSLTTPNLSSPVVSNTTADTLVYSNGTKTLTSASIGSISGTPDANGIVFSGGTLQLTPASATLGGVVTSGTQSFKGKKTFVDDMTIGSNLIYTPTEDSTTTGSNATLSHPTTYIHLTNASLSSIALISVSGGVASGHVVFVTNMTGNSITLVNNYGSPTGSAKVIITATGGDLVIPDGGGATFIYETTGSEWHIIALNRGLIPLASGVSGFLPIANGGTNSSTSLNNNRVIQSSGGALVEAAAITASRALVSDSNGIPTHTSVTTTEIGYVSGVTSAIQTQLNTKLTAASFKADWALATGTTKVVTHSLGTLDVVVQVYDKADGQTILVDTVTRTDTNTVTLTSSQAPNASGWRVLIQSL